MKFRNTKLSKRTIALFMAALVLIGAGGTTGTRAALTVFSDDYDAVIRTDTLNVELTENRNVVEDGKLYTSIGKKVEPTRTYADAVGVVNNGGAPEYVRVIVRKYWTDDKGNKTTAFDPSLIELEATDSWSVQSGGSPETEIYYLKKALGVNGEETLFNNIRISGDVLEEGVGKTVDGVTDGTATKTVITYTYIYNGYSFNVEAEAQAVQTHNAKDAIKSIWGVDASSVGINVQ